MEFNKKGLTETICCSLLFSIYLYFASYAVCYIIPSFGKLCENRLFVTNDTVTKNLIYEYFTEKNTFIFFSVIGFATCILSIFILLFSLKCMKCHIITKYIKKLNAILFYVATYIFVGFCLSIIYCNIGYQFMWFFVDQKIIDNMYVICIVWVGCVLVNITLHILEKLYYLTDDTTYTL